MVQKEQFPPVFQSFTPKKAKGWLNIVLLLNFLNYKPLVYVTLPDYSSAYI